MAKKQVPQTRYAVLHLPTMQTVMHLTRKGWVTEWFPSLYEAINKVDRCCTEQSPRSDYSVITIAE